MRILENKEVNGVEVYFDSKPSAEIIGKLKANGFRWHSVKKCWYIKNNDKNKEVIDKLYNNKLDGNKCNGKSETYKLKSLRIATAEEVDKIVKEFWQNPEMQEYYRKQYDYYVTEDELYLRLEKIGKIEITKTLWYDDETEAPDVNFENFKHYNDTHFPARAVDNYLKEKEHFEKVGCGSGKYDYQGMYFVNVNINSETMVGVNWFSDGDYKIRYLTAEETEDYIHIMHERQEKYIERLHKYFNKYGQFVHAEGYWANR